MINSSSKNNFTLKRESSIVSNQGLVFSSRKLSSSQIVQPLLKSKAASKFSDQVRQPQPVGINSSKPNKSIKGRRSQSIIEKPTKDTLQRHEKPSKKKIQSSKQSLTIPDELNMIDKSVMIAQSTHVNEMLIGSDKGSIDHSSTKVNPFSRGMTFQSRKAVFSQASPTAQEEANQTNAQQHSIYSSNEVANSQ